MRRDEEHAAHFAKASQLLQNGVRRWRFGHLADARKTGEQARARNREAKDAAPGFERRHFYSHAWSRTFVKTQMAWPMSGRVISRR
jgi:hypothetical protein